MVAVMVSISAFLLANMAWTCDADAFLQAREEDNYIPREDVERTFSELSDFSASAKLRSIEKELRPMYQALPKNNQGKLEPSVVRYALHRFFVQQHGWYMGGLDPAGGSWTGATSSNLMKDRAPAYILNLFEQRLEGQGMGLQELAIFASVLADLVHKEAFDGMFKVYSSLRLPTVGAVPKRWSVQAIKAYLIQYLIGGNLNITSLDDFEFLDRELPSIYPDWHSTYMWAEDIHAAHDLTLEPRRNPFVPPTDTFDGSVACAQELGHQFGSFQDLECKALKARLVEMEHRGTGRVRLSRFYAGGVNGDWTLSESVAYLRNLGVLDETDPGKPSVVITNYMHSQTNCLTSSGFYSVCCSDECEGLMQHLEVDIAAPTATPARIATSVSMLHSDTVDAPRNLSSMLLSRLDDIAEFHKGHVPLHGRLFAQWMHHAYPRECPFPHVSGTTSPMTPDQWMRHHGINNIEATVEDMKLHHARMEQEANAQDEDLSLPWTQVEELVSGHESAWRSFWAVALRCAMAFAALASFAVPLVRASKLAMSGCGAGKVERCLV